MNDIVVAIGAILVGCLIGWGLAKDYKAYQTLNVGEVTSYGYGYKYKGYSKEWVSSLYETDKDNAIHELKKQNARRFINDEPAAIMVELYYKDIN